MRLTFLALALTVTLGWQVDDLANAIPCHFETHTTFVNGHLYTQTIQVCPATSATEPISDQAVDPPRDSGLDAICVATAMSAGADPFEFCDIPPESRPEVTPGLVAVALRRIQLPAASIQVQPPNGRTLVNFETNFSTDTVAFDRTVTLLGRRVELHIVPSAFGWRFGDGAELTTDEPGAPYPDLEVTHSYLHKGRVAPRVDTTYTARFRVDGGPWRDVPGSVTIAGAPVDLEVLTATPTLVGYGRG